MKLKKQNNNANKKYQQSIKKKLFIEIKTQAWII